MVTDFSNYKFHPSMLGELMTESRSKGDIGETFKSALMSCFIEAKYGRKKNIQNKYIEKGLAVEEDSITLYSRVKKKFFQKNEETLVNDFFIGTPDLFEGPSIHEATAIIDIKSSWNIHTFFSTIIKPQNKSYYWQGQAYMDLTGAKTFKLVYCLVSAPEQIINDEKRRLAWQMGVATDDNELAQKAFEELDREMIFDDIPIEERWIQQVIMRDDNAIESAKEKMKVCRDFLNKLIYKLELIES